MLTCWSLCRNSATFRMKPVFLADKCIVKTASVLCHRSDHFADLFDAVWKKFCLKMVNYTWFLSSYLWIWKSTWIHCQKISLWTRCLLRCDISQWLLYHQLLYRFLWQTWIWFGIFLLSFYNCWVVKPCII